MAKKICQIMMLVAGMSLVSGLSFADSITVGNSNVGRFSSAIMPAQPRCLSPEHIAV